MRIFTPGHEMPFAGHPTLGTAEVVATLGGGLDTVHLSMPAGRIPVTRVDGGWRLDGPTGDPARGGLERCGPRRGAGDRGRGPRALRRELGRRRGRAARRAARRRGQRPRLRPRPAPDGRAHDVARSAPARLRLGLERAQEHRGPALLRPGPSGPRGPGHRIGVRQPRWLARGAGRPRRVDRGQPGGRGGPPVAAAPRHRRPGRHPRRRTRRVRRPRHLLAREPWGRDRGHLHRLPPRRQRRPALGQDGASASTPVRQRASTTS